MITHDPEDGRPLCVFTYYKHAAESSNPQADRIRRAFVLENSIDSGAFRPSDNRVQNPWNVVRVAGSLITHSGERHFGNPDFFARGRSAYALVFKSEKRTKSTA